jgi:hypothetical protein
MHSTIATRLTLVAMLMAAACGVGSINQTTASSGQPATNTTGGNTGTGVSSGTSGNPAPTGGADGSVGTSGGATAADGTATAGGATTADGTTPTAGVPPDPNAPAGQDPNAVLGQDPNAAPGQDPNAAGLFNLSALSAACCYYDSLRSTITVALNTDTQYCAHAALGSRIGQAHELSISGSVAQSPNTKAGTPSGGSVGTVAKPTATLSLYDATCTLSAQATAPSGSVELTQLDSTACKGIFTLSLKQTLPTRSNKTTTVTGSFTAANCAAMAVAPRVSRCETTAK